MWLANLLRQFVILYLKFLLCVAGLLISLGYINMAWQRAQSSPSALLVLVVLCCLVSLAAYFIRESQRPSRERREARRGAERTPVLPHDRRETC